MISKPRTVKFQIFINFHVECSSQCQKACLFDVGGDPSLEQEIKLEIKLLSFALHRRQLKIYLKHTPSESLID